MTTDVPDCVHVLGPLLPRRTHVQRTDARRRGQPGGALGTMAWEEWVVACRRTGMDPETWARRGGVDYAAVCLMLGREVETWVGT